MNTNWSKILLFSLLSFALGFLVARTCCRGGGCHGGGCGKERGECHGESRCEHGGGCCSEGGTCDKEGCDHTMGGACCKGEMHAEGKGACCKGGHGDGHGHMGLGDDKVHVIIDGLKEKNFQGDTTVSIDGGTVHVTRTGDKMEVKVELKDSVSVEKTVEVHTH
jgi:hypothetical protein